MTETQQNFRKIPVGISSCLLGEEVRFDGGHKRDAYINGTLAQYFEFVPFCPEMGIGLGKPREPIRLVRMEGDLRVRGTKHADIDVTDQLSDYAKTVAPQQTEFCGYILKKGSPSCGMERVKVYNVNGMPDGNDSGAYAAALMHRFPDLPVEEEGRLGDPLLRENFIHRVFAYQRWRSDVLARPSINALTDFHAVYKLVLMSHHQDDARELGRIAAAANTENLDTKLSEYFSLFMTSMKKIATRRNHVNVLQHIQGYLKKQLSADDKAELVETLEQYRQNLLPLIVPVTLLKHHFRRFPDPYIEKSYYLQPHPLELKLLNVL